MVANMALMQALFKVVYVEVTLAVKNYKIVTVSLVVTEKEILAVL